MTSNYSTIEVEAEEIEYKNEMSHSIYLGLCYNISQLPNIVLYRTHSDDK